MAKSTDRLNLAKLSLRVALTIAFGYAGLGSILHPRDWVGYFPVFINQLPFVNTIFLVFSIGEIGLTLWLLSGFKTKYAAILAALMLIGIVGANFSDLSILFRDLALIFSAIALVLLS